MTRLGPSGLAFQTRNVLAPNPVGTLDVINRHWTVVDLSRHDNPFVIGVGRKL
jgi:hypothetical protein